VASDAFRGDGAPGRAPGGAPGGSAAAQHPAAMVHGPGHRIVHANEAFRAELGRGVLGMPAAEAIVDFPSEAFDGLDLAYREGRAVACRVTVRGSARRLVVAPIRDIETGEVYGVRLHLVPAGERPE
jgi:hypothetical protein